MGTGMNEFQFKSIVQFLNEKFEETGDPRKLWTEQTITNLPKIKKSDGIWSMKKMLVDDNEKAVVIVGASPCLEKDVATLKTLDEHFILIVVNSALKRVLKEGIRPDYVWMMDSNDTDMAKHLDIDRNGSPWHSKDLTLVTSNASSSEAIKNWKGKIIWVPYYAIDPEYKTKIRALLGRTSPMGGNAFSSALATAYDVWGARIFVFVGNELCYDNQYYADKKSKWEKKNVMHFKVKDVTGEERLTNIPLYQYKMWIEKMIDELPHCTFIDTSYGILGTDCERLQLMELPEAIDRIKRAFMDKERAREDWRFREKLRYDNAYASGTYAPAQGLHSWKAIFNKFPHIKEIKTVLDVGCGFGQGIAMCRKKGIEAWGIDISDKLDTYWAVANICRFCKVASADEIPFPDNSMDLVTSFDMLEHIPEEAVLSVLKEMRRVTKEYIIATISLVPAVNKMIDGSEPHICIKPIDWWVEKLKEAGLKKNSFALNPEQTVFTIYSVKENEYARSEVPGDNMHVQLG
jgi:SAM-dependent methyltransferase